MLSTYKWSMLVLLLLMFKRINTAAFFFFFKTMWIRPHFFFFRCFTHMQLIKWQLNLIFLDYIQFYPLVFHWEVWYPVILVYKPLPFTLKWLLLRVQGRWKVRLICLTLLGSLSSTISLLGISPLTGVREVLVMHTELKLVFAKFHKKLGQVFWGQHNFSLWDALHQTFQFNYLVHICILYNCMYNIFTQSCNLYGKYQVVKNKSFESY